MERALECVRVSDGESANERMECIDRVQCDLQCAFPEDN